MTWSWSFPDYSLEYQSSPFTLSSFFWAGQRRHIVVVLYCVILCVYLVVLLCVQQICHPEPDVTSSKAAPGNRHAFVWEPLQGRSDCGLDQLHSYHCHVRSWHGGGHQRHWRNQCLLHLYLSWYELSKPKYECVICIQLKHHHIIHMIISSLTSHMWINKHVSQVLWYFLYHLTDWLIISYLNWTR